MSLEKIQLKDFWNHRLVSIPLDPGITTIGGPSDRGKTSIIRALKWVALNKPTGDGVIHWDANSAKVRVIAEGHRIVRTRSGSENSYKLDGKVFKAFGTDVPDEIGTLLNLSPEINFQGQHDPPFWFSLSAGEVSRRLNQIVNLELIDRTLKTIGSDVREYLTRQKVSKERVEELRTDIKKYAFVDDLEASLTAAEATEKEVSDLARRLAVSVDLRNRAVRVRSSLKIKRERLKMAQKAASVGCVMSELTDTTSDLADLRSRYIKYETLAAIKLPDLTGLRVLRDGIVTLQEVGKNLSYYRQRIVQIESRIGNRTDLLNERQKELQSWKGKPCPTCGKPMNL